MNRRLLLYLYDRSGLGAYMPVDFKGHELQVEEHMEKFVELIVKECSKWIVDNADSMEHLGPECFSKAMEQHFGAE